MARQARIFSETGMYHIMFRGLNKQGIFSDEKDYAKIKDIITSAKDKTDMQIYAYCMMPNHVHLFVREAQKGDISIFMKKVLSHYAGWYNFKYERSGHLFANRYKSIPVEDDSYFLTLARYIHQNPVKAMLSENMQEYKYSSYADYISNDDDFTDIDFLLNMFDENRKVAIKKFEEFSNLENEETDYEDSIRQKDVAAKCKIIQITGGLQPSEIRNLPKTERYELLKKLIEEHKIQKIVLERLTGISRRTMSKL